MKINQKILSIPPYISTSWKNVLSLHIDKREGHSILVIGLVNGSTIEIPGLDSNTLKATFAAHSKHLEREESVDEIKQGPIGPLMPPQFAGDPSAVLSLPIQFGIDTHMGNILQHNQEASDSPDLPQDVLEKITTLAQSMGFAEMDHFPKPEPHCNCVHCQIMRAMQQKQEDNSHHELSENEEVSDDELRFRDWDIKQQGDKLYIVTNPLNQTEHYDVFLGSPVGCTCGQSNCEHIKAVLNS